MEQQPLNPEPQQGDLNWRLSAHPITLLCFLGFRTSALLMYLFGVLFIKNLYVPLFCSCIAHSCNIYTHPSPLVGNLGDFRP